MFNELRVLYGRLVTTPGEVRPPNCQQIETAHLEYLSPDSLTVSIASLALESEVAKAKDRMEIVGKHTRVVREKIPTPGDKRYFLEMERDESWDYRKALISELLSKNVVGGSIVPTDPSVLQTWYVKLSSVEEDPTEKSSIFAITVGEENTPKKGTRPLIGFIAPFPEYSSPKYLVDQRPEMSARKINVFQKGNRKACLNQFKTPSSKRKCEEIWEYFSNDQYSKELAFTILDPKASTAKIKRLHLSKSSYLPHS